MEENRFVELVTSPEVSLGEYLHWDKFRFHQVPEGRTIEDWWLAQKFKRQAQVKYLPVTMPDHKAFGFVSTDYIQDWLHKFDRKMGALDSLPKAIDNEPNRQVYLLAALLDEAYASSVLEGAVATREQAREMIRHARKPRNLSERMIMNNYLTMQQLGQFKQEPMSMDLLLRIHRLIAEGALDRPDAAGRLRRPDEPVEVADDETVFYVPPAAEKLPNRLIALIDLANETMPDYFLHPILRAIILHFLLAYEHPFVDGNGRTARALFYWSMLKSGYPQFEYISISQFIRRAPIKYARAFLEVETDDGDLTYFIHHQLQVIEQAMHQLEEHVQKKHAELDEIESKLRRIGDFNHRQQDLLIHALKKPQTRYTIQGHKISQGVTYQTARADLLGLEEAGLLVQSKQGKAFIFKAIPDLVKKLKSPGKT